MTKLILQRESHTTATRHTSLTVKDANDDQVVAGSDHPIPVNDLAAARLSEGNLFSISHVRTTSNLLVQDESMYVAIAFASNTPANMTVTGVCSGDAELYIYESSTVTGGSSASASRLNRSSTHSSDSAVLLDPMVSDSGTLLGTYIMSGGRSRALGSIPPVILSPLTTYLIELKCVSQPGVGIDGTGVSGFLGEISLVWSEE